ncbi:MAG TPA: phenylacetate--CoA ligase, partial [Deltaproteobacteria bacterium]|nr:phenylacetate--CoA ligase [Deltaproteobacteria bacterium]
MYWNKQDECITRHELEELQLRKLKKTLELASKSPFYRKKGLGDYTIRDLNDVKKLPVTTKQD